VLDLAEGALRRAARSTQPPRAAFAANAPGKAGGSEPGRDSSPTATGKVVVEVGSWGAVCADSRNTGGSVKVVTDSSARSETCGVLAGQVVRRRDLENEGCRALNWGILERAMIDLETVWDLRQGVSVTDPSAASLDFAEVEDWFLNTALDGPCSLAMVAENVDLEAGWVRRKISEWKNRRMAGETTLRLIPPQHP